MPSSHDLPSGAGRLKTQAGETARKVGDHLNEQAYLIRDTASNVRYHAEDFIQNNPWPAVAAAAGVGFLLGLVLARRS